MTDHAARAPADDETRHRAAGAAANVAADAAANVAADAAANVAADAAVNVAADAAANVAADAAANVAADAAANVAADAAVNVAADAAVDDVVNATAGDAVIGTADIATRARRPATASDAGAEVADYLRAHVRTVPDWPIAGVQFRDITPLLASADVMRVIVDAFVRRYRDQRIDYFAGLEARGFILAPLLAYALGAGFIPIRKKGKLPFETIAETYLLEYGEATVEVHRDACRPGDRVVLVDDLIATGGTMLAGRRLIERLGGDTVEGAALIDLPDLGGAARLLRAGLPLFTLCAFSGH